AEAERLFQHAIRLEPDDATAHHWYSTTLLVEGKTAEAIAEIDRARRLDPLSPIVTAAGAWIRYLAGNAAEAELLSREALEKDPEFVPALLDLGISLEKSGKFGEAGRVLGEAVRISNHDPEIVAFLAEEEAEAGSTETARR